MKKYIDLEKLEKNLEIELENSTDYCDAIDFAIEDTPIEDVAPVVHAHWEDTGKEISVCTSCKSYWVNAEDKYDYSFCPHCGAKMDEESENNG